MPAANPGSGLTINEGYHAFNGPYADATGYGGDCTIYLAGGTINVGDAVYLSAANTASSGVTANNALRLGVAVGGKQTRNRTFPEVKRGVLAANAGEWVVVCVVGKVSCVAGGTVAVGGKLAFRATARQVITTRGAA